MNYIQYEFLTKDEARRDFLIALLSDLGFDGFEETYDSLKAFVPQNLWNHDELTQTLLENLLGDIESSYTTIQPQNWNEQWEKSFDPLLIAGQVSIRAPFHQHQPAKYELIIEPKMSFGTGHHATTALMIEQMLSIDMHGLKVVDYGSGTGVLAILAEKLGATSVLAIDNEEWAVENSIENISRNNCERINVEHGNTMAITTEVYDVMLANINRNVIMNNIASWRKSIVSGGILIVSGILLSDTKDIINTAISYGYQEQKTMEQDGWVSILFNS
jgi:ribosomal protein L11 methyltransferase